MVSTSADGSKIRIANTKGNQTKLMVTWDVKAISKSEDEHGMEPDK